MNWRLHRFKVGTLITAFSGVTGKIAKHIHGMGTTSMPHNEAPWYLIEWNAPYRHEQSWKQMPVLECYIRERETRA